MDISSLLNPVKSNISPRNRHYHSDVYDKRSGADLSYSLENNIRSEVVKKSHPARGEAHRLGVTREGSIIIHYCDGHEVNEPLARLQLGNKDSNHGSPPPLVGFPPGYPSLAFSNSDEICTLPTVGTTTSRFKTTSSVQHKVVGILSSSCIETCVPHSYRVESGSTGSSISSPSSLVGLRGSPLHSPCSIAAESSMDGSRSFFPGSPPEYDYLSSPTNSLIAFASVAVGDYGFMASGDPRVAETTTDRANALPSSVDRIFGNPGLLHGEASGLSSNGAKRGDGGLSDSLLSERVATMHATSQPDSYSGYYCGSPRSQFRESFERTHCQGYNYVQAGLGNGSAASPTTSNQSTTDGGSDVVAVPTEYTHTTPTLSCFSPAQQGITPLPQALELQTQIPTASSRSSQTVIPNNSSARNTGPRCSYTSNCTTGSPLRKVVSHIFGRNKLCTRQIPKGVWVHYCRKHYQRSRYRNPRGFALLQCDLVRKQIKRLQDWGGVTDWMMKVRKREEERLNKENAEALAAVADADSASRCACNNRVAGNRDNRDGTITSSSMAGAWGWLVQSTGSGKSTADVLKILDRIETEIASSGSNFPDVEILPVVVAATTTTSTGTASDRTEEVSSSTESRLDWRTISPGSVGLAGTQQQRPSLLNEESHRAATTTTIERRSSRKRRMGTKSDDIFPSHEEFPPATTRTAANAESYHPLTTEGRQTKRARVSTTAATTSTTMSNVMTRDGNSEGNNGIPTRPGVIITTGNDNNDDDHDHDDDGHESTTENTPSTTKTTTTRRRSLRRSTRTSTMA